MIKNSDLKHSMNNSHFVWPDNLVKEKNSLFHTLSDFQKNLNSMLSLFMTDYFLTNLGKIRYPIQTPLCVKRVNSSLKKLHNSISELDNIGINIDKEKLLLNNILKSSKVNIEEIAKLISSLYIFLEKAIISENFSSIKFVNKKISAPSNFNEKLFFKLDKDTYSPIIRLKRNIESNLHKEIVNIYICGSLATLDYVNKWSDLDSLAIIKRESVCNPFSLIKIRKVLFSSLREHYKIQPIMTHGYFVFTEIDLNFYPDTIFPIVLLKTSLSLFENNTKLNFRIRPDNSFAPFLEHIKALDFFVSKSLDNISKGRNILNGISFSRWHNLLHSLLLLPTLYLQVKGINVYKRESFSIVRDELGNDIFNPIDKVSEIRKSWIQPRFISKQFETFLLKSSYPLIIKEIYDKIGESTFLIKYKPVLNSNFVEELILLANTMMNNLIEQGFLKIDSK